jgi:hypothetical protein
MAPITNECGIINNELVTLSGFGSFHVGWGDYTIKQNSANVGIKVKNGSFIDQINPIVWAIDISLYDVSTDALSGFRFLQKEAIKSYINGGGGVITVTLAGITLSGCLVKALNIEQAYYDNAGDYKISKVSISLERPVMEWI